MKPFFSFVQRPVTAHKDRSLCRRSCKRKTGEIFLKKYHPKKTCQNDMNCNTSITANVVEGFSHLVHSWTSINFNLVLIAARWFFGRQCSGSKSAGLAGVSSGVGLDDGLLVCTLLLLIWPNGLDSPWVLSGVAVLVGCWL